MAQSKTVEIICPECKRESLVRREGVYDGFRRVGEKISCAACGYVFPSEAAIPFKAKKITPGFGPQDLPAKSRVFGKDEIAETLSRLCRHCAHYVVNPFLQRCGRTNREVEATDTCEHFITKQPESEPRPEGEPPPP